MAAPLTFPKALSKFARLTEAMQSNLLEKGLPSLKMSWIGRFELITSRSSSSKLVDDSRNGRGNETAPRNFPAGHQEVG